MNTESAESTEGAAADEVPYFGGCPVCRQTDGYMNVGRTHWFVCDTHRTKWCIGMNLFSSWHEETEDEWRINEKKLQSYREVTPVYDEALRKPQKELEPYTGDIPF